MDQRRFSVVVCASQYESSLAGFMKFLQERFPDSVNDVEFIEIPYNGIDSFRFKRPVDVLILCHSINNRRFSITNVPDALYDKFLLMAKSFVGHDKIAVVVHDLPYPVGSEDKTQRMDNFRHRQPLTFQCSRLVFTCGKLGVGQPPEIDDDDQTELGKFLANAQQLPENASSVSGQRRRIKAICLFVVAIGMTGLFIWRWRLRMLFN